jgi:hypothetical protein
MKNTKTILTSMVIAASIAFTGAVTVVEAPVEKWSCFDYSTHFAAENSDWGIVTMSQNQWFRGVSHMVNYKNVTADSMEIHDGLYGQNYTLYDWQDQKMFFHFWKKESMPVRNYRVMQDNRYEILT